MTILARRRIPPIHATVSCFIDLLHEKDDVDADDGCDGDDDDDDDYDNEPISHYPLHIHTFCC